MPLRFARFCVLLPALLAANGGCSNPAPPPSPAAGTCHYDALAVLSDYSASGLGGFTLADKGYLEYGSLSGDPELSTSAGRAFFVARDVGQIYELDPACGTPIAGAVFNANNGAGAGSTDPQDIAVAPDGTLWIPRYLHSPSVLALEPDGGVARSIDITSYDPDGNPNASAVDVETVGDAGAKAFVALEVLDDDTSASSPYPTPYPNNPSLILRIDVATRAIETAIPLAGRNPFGLFLSYGGALWMAEPGNVDQANETNAGIERFDPQTSTSSLVVKESDLAGASVMEVAITAGCGAAIVADPSTKNLTALVTFDPVSGKPFTTWATPAFGPTADFDLQGMLWVGSVLLVGDRAVAANGMYAVHAFDLAAPCTLKERADSIYLGLQPVAFRAPPR